MYRVSHTIVMNFSRGGKKGNHDHHTQIQRNAYLQAPKTPMIQHFAEEQQRNLQQQAHGQEGKHSSIWVALCE